LAAEQLSKLLHNVLPVALINTDTTVKGALNNSCGADFVKTSQSLPLSLQSSLKPGQRACSLDGDADRLIYFYLDDKGHFHMLDGDKIAALVADFIVGLVKLAGLEENIQVGVVQTAYANGASTKYLLEVSSYTMYTAFFDPLSAFTCKMRSDWRQASPSCSRTV
jgi:phosphoacetylglucosamine mutase